MTDTRQRWIDAGCKLAATPDAEVLCPECQQHALKVEDVRPDARDELVERHMTCPSCGAANSLRLKRPESAV